MRSFKLNNLGIGDITILAADLFVSGENEFEIEISQDILKYYRKNCHVEYEEFCKNYILSILSHKNIIFKSDLGLPDYNLQNYNLFSHALNDNVCDYFTNKFKKNLKFIDECYIVINSKVRLFSKNEFEKDKYYFFDEINKLGKRVVILGEREIEYNLEYEIHGSNQVYSIYKDALELIDSSLIHDMTIPKLGLTTPNLENLFNDMSIAYNACSIINIGVGGFFCTSIFSKKLRALTCLYPHVDGIYTFQNIQSLMESVKSLLNDKNL
jgi:hypothetical protein